MSVFSAYFFASLRYKAAFFAIMQKSWENENMEIMNREDVKRRKRNNRKKIRRDNKIDRIKTTLF